MSSIAFGYLSDWVAAVPDSGTWECFPLHVLSMYCPNFWLDVFMDHRLRHGRPVLRSLVP